MLITAKFNSVCLQCKRPIKTGDRISWVKGDKGSRHALCSQEGAAVQTKLEASKAVDSDAVIPVPEGLEYLPYQRAGIAYALSRPGTLIADEMGLGKTVQAIGVINGDESIKSVLVICPASVKLNWRNELEKWLVRGDTMSVAVSPAIGDVTVINYDVLSRLPEGAVYDLLIVDEAQYAKNGKAQRTKNVQALAKRAKRKLFLTGTPILNRPIELWSLLQSVAPDEWDPAGFVKGQSLPPGGGAGFFRFAKRYCDAKEVWFGKKSHWEFKGATNLPELNERLRSTCMVRRLKADVLKDLPPKRRQTIVLPPTGFEDEEDAWATAAGLTLEDLSSPRVEFDGLSAFRHKMALAKLPYVQEHVTDVLESGEKVILFCHHKDVAASLLSSFETEFGAVCITGDTTVAGRQAAVERFQTDDNCRVMVASLMAAGVGLTLTAATMVIFAELAWRPADLSQGEDRAHRIGQTRSILIQHLVSDRSLDSRMSRMLIAKQEVADLALDGEVGFSDDYLSRDVVGPKVVRPSLVSQEEKSTILRQLRMLAGVCDGAWAKDDMGFNGVDSAFGKALAACSSLSDRQALAARKMLVKYQKTQLSGV